MTKTILSIFITVCLATATAQTLEITSTGVGIGTTNPQEALHIVGSGTTKIRIDGGSLTGSQIRVGTAIPGATVDGISIIPGTSQGVCIPQSNGGGIGAVFTSDGKVGIGTTNPRARLSLLANEGTNVEIVAYAHFGSDYSAWSTIVGSNVRAKNGQNAGMELATGYLALGASAVRLNFGTIEFHVASSADIAGFTEGTAFSFPRMVIQATGNVGIGTSSPGYKLTVSGPVRASQFIADVNTYSDFVFKPDYRLAPLAAVEAAIKQDGHLPGIPGEAEAKTCGLDLGVMQMKLLQKVEELTLYVIQLKKENDALRSRVAALESKP